MTYTSFNITLAIPVCGVVNTRKDAGLPGPPDEAVVQEYWTQIIGKEMANNILEIFLDELHPHWRVEAEKAILAAAEEDSRQAADDRMEAEADKESGA